MLIMLLIFLVRWPCLKASWPIPQPQISSPMESAFTGARRNLSTTKSEHACTVDACFKGFRIRRI